MKKLSWISFFLAMIVTITAGAEYSTSDIEASINKAFSWQEQNAPVQSSPGSLASDYYIMALSHMNRNYNFKAYTKLIENINPSTKQDGQRLVMATSACSERLSDSFVGWYTYDAQFDNASDLAGALITLDSGGYEAKGDNGDINYMVCRLLSMQQSNGSFSNDELATAKAIIALSPRVDVQYRLNGHTGNEMYVYNCKTALENALGYLSATQQQSGGFSTIMNTAYAVMALNSVGINADTDTTFIKNGVSPVAYLMSLQAPDGSVNKSADDTALVASALVSQLMYLNNSGLFFNFVSAAAETPTASARDFVMDTEETAQTQQPQQTAAPIVEVTPLPEKKPEHSAMTEEEYGPMPFVGPKYDESKAKEKKTFVSSDEQTDTVEESNFSMVSIIIVSVMAIIAAAAFVYLMLLKKNPDKLKMLENKLRVILKKPPINYDKDEITEQQPEKSLLNEIDALQEVVPTEELYDPDFIKKLIPVDEIDSSVDGLIPKDDEK